ADLRGSDLSWTGSLVGDTESTVRVSTLTYTGTGTAAHPGGDASAAFTITGGVAATLVGEGTVTAHLTRDRAEVAGRVPALGASLDATIATASPYAYDATAHVDRLGLTTLTPLADVPADAIAGTVSFNAAAHGTLADTTDADVSLDLQNIDAT